MWRKLTCALLVIFTVSMATAAVAWKHGNASSQLPVFDPNSMGGMWSCWGPTGSCGPGAFANSFDAGCAGGSTGTTAALLAWLAYGNSLGSTLAKLMIPPGTVCSFGTNQSLVCDVQTSPPAHPAIQNAYIWAYGASWDQMQFGGNGFLPNQPGGYNPTLDGQGFSSAYINTATAGATSVTVNDGHVGIFNTGDWIIITAIAGQGSGFGPTHQLHEHRQITGIVGNVVSFSGGLTNTYKSTYPNFNINGQRGQGGPAAIYRMDPNCFNTTVTYAGITLTTPATSVQNNMSGKSVTLLSVTNLGGLGPGAMVSGTITGGYMQTVEMDKDIASFAYSGTTIQQNISFQSSSPNTITMDGVKVNGSVVGSPVALTISNSNIVGDLQVGATVSGGSTSLTLTNMFYGNGRPAGQEIPKASLSYSSGNFTISTSNLQLSSFPGLFFPGHKYFLGDSHGDNTCTPLTTFTVSDVSESAGTTTIATDLVGALPTLSCAGDGGANFSTYARYELMSLTQSGVTNGGSALLSNGKVLAPP